MAHKKLDSHELMKATEKLLLEKGYGGFNFSVLSSLLHIGRSTLYEYYPTKDDLIADYMKNVMQSYLNEFQIISLQEDPKEQLLLAIQVIPKYTHVHSIFKMLPLLQSTSDTVEITKQQLKENHMSLFHMLVEIIEKGKKEKVIRKNIPTDILAGMIFNMIDPPLFLTTDQETWSNYVTNILFEGIEPNK